MTAVFGSDNLNAYVYQNGTYTPISQNAQNAVGINNVGTIVTISGAVAVYQNGALVGYFYPPYAGSYDLNDSGQFLFATALAAPTAAAIPEPASLLLFASGLLGLGAAIQRKHRV